MTPALTAARSAAEHVDDIVREIAEALAGVSPAALLVFSSPRRPGPEVARRLAALWPEAVIAGCSTAGEVGTGVLTNDSVCVAALPAGLAVRAASALGDCGEGGVGPGVEVALDSLERTVGPLRALDPARHLALVLIDSTHGIEEEVHVHLGNRAPLLAFVGGSAGDGLLFERTEVFTASASTTHGCVLMILECSVPFLVSKTCHFAPTGQVFRATRTDGRRLLELDGEPAAQVYARHVGCPVEQLSFETLFLHPAGLVIDGKAWVRQVNPPVVDGGGIILGCAVAQGSEVHFLKPSVDLVSHFESELASVTAKLGPIRGALMFDCALRRLELEKTNTKDAYAALITFPAAGFNTHGESWIGHMHQTLTAVYFGGG